MKKKLLIVGATGLVGLKMIEVLVEEKMIDRFDLTLVSSEDSEGKIIKINNKNYILKKLSKDLLLDKYDYVLFATSSDISKIWVPLLAKSGTIVIDNSSAFRQVKDIPLVVPEINIKDAFKSNIIANPNCTTIQLAIVLNRLKNLLDIKKVIVSTYQAVSGAGKDALFDLENQTTNFFKEGINDNLIEQIGDITESGFCDEENKVMFELNKILKTNYDVLATTVRVPVKNCHGESVYINFSNSIELKDIENILNSEELKIVTVTPAFNKISNTNLTYVSRLRVTKNNELLFFVVADNLRRGASYNAVKILDCVDKLR